MMIDPSTFWPEIRKEHSAHFHALGLIIATYNGLEFALFNLFVWYLKIEDSISAYKIFGAMNNSKRLDCLRDTLDRVKNNGPAVDAVQYFISAFDVLTSNRNLLAHSLTMIERPDQEHVTFRKGTRNEPHKWGFTDLTVPQLHKIAQDMRDFEIFGLGVFGHLKAAREGILAPDGKNRIALHLPLPTKPPQPEKLRSVPPEDRQSPPPQPAPSGG